MSFYDDVIKQSFYFNSPSLVHDMNMLEPITRAAVQAILAEAGEMGIHVMVFETYRSQQRQELVYAQGASQLKTVGTHHYGVSCDIVKRVDNGPNWKGDFSFMGPLARKHGLVWGGPGEGNLNIGDLDHVQRVAFHDQARLFDGSWYPSADYSAFA